MADNVLIIPKTPTLDNSEDYSFLRKEGLKFIEKLSSKVWTDYNEHDPGITMLELLCYAITDLGYRTSFSIPDLLAPDPDNANEKNADIHNFFSAKEILPVNPVSETDIRKVIMDVAGVKNAWLTIAKDYEQRIYIDHTDCDLTLDKTKGAKILPVSGLYNVLIQYEDDNGVKEQYDKINDAVRGRLMLTRNLCEDYLSITQVQYEDIAICSDIEVRQDANVAKVQAKIYQALIDYFSPPVNYYTLEEMIDKGKPMDEIFEGPLLKSGFIDDAELEKSFLRKFLHTSDLYNIIMDIPEVTAIKTLVLIRYVNGEVQEESEWTIELNDLRAARLEKTRSKIIFYKGVLPYMANAAEIEEELRQLEQSNIHFRKKGHKTDIEIPKGNYRNITDYFPVQNDFPLVYGIGQAGLPKNATPQRQAQALQLKSYLLFCEQLLTDFLAQLSNIKKLFSCDHSIDRDKVEQLRLYLIKNATRIITDVNELAQENADNVSLPHFGIGSHSYFAQELKEIDQLNSLFKTPGAYTTNPGGIIETPEIFSERRNRFLDHILARFCEDMSEYSLTLYQMYGKFPKGELLTGLRVAADKESLLQDYPKLSRDRGRAFNYKPAYHDDELKLFDMGIWETQNIAGMKLRVARLLGMGGDKPDELALECFKTGKTTSYVVTLYAMDKKTVLLKSRVFWTSKPAHELLEDILFEGKIAGNFKAVDSNATDFKFQLVDIANGNVLLAESEIYHDKPSRNKAMSDAQDILGGLDPADHTHHIDPVKYLKTKTHSQYKVTLYDQDHTTVLLEVNKGFKNREEAETEIDNIIFSAQYEHNFVKSVSGIDFLFDLRDCCNHSVVIATSLLFATQQERDEMYDRTLKLFSDNRMRDVIRRRSLATALLDIHPKLVSGVQYWTVMLADANDPLNYILISEDEDSVECAESIMLYMLHNGDNPNMYKVIKVTGGFSYAFYDDCGNQVATGDETKAVATENEAQQLIDCIVRFFHQSCDIENFHVIEHILLRPRTNLDTLMPSCIECSEPVREQMKMMEKIYRTEKEKALTQKDLDDWKEDKKDLAVIRGIAVSLGKLRAEPLAGTPPYAFEIYRLDEKEKELQAFHAKEDELEKLVKELKVKLKKQNKIVAAEVTAELKKYEPENEDWATRRMLDIIRSQRSAAQLKFLQKNTDLWGFVLNDSLGYPVLYSEGYVELNGCTNGIASVRENGTNTSIDVPGVKRYGSKIKDAYLGNYRIFPRKGDYYFNLYADNSQVIASCAISYESVEDAAAEIHNLVDYFAFATDATGVTDPCQGHDADPYSFRVSVILPAWPTRFRSQYFRKYVERVIRLETPAHIYSKVCWIDLAQMKNFEHHYRLWLKTLASNAIPNPNTVSQFIHALTSLENVYPVAVLHSCEDVSGDEAQVILDNSMLGNL
jgi:uncharacterized protein YegP (UPF0339 family)